MLKVENSEYALPVNQHSSMKWYMHFIYLFLMLIMAIAFFAFDDKNISDLFFKLVSGFFELFFFYIWIYVGVLKKSYLIINEDFIELKSAFIKRKIFWKIICDMQVYAQGRNTFIGLVTRDKLKRQKKSFWAWINSSYGGEFTLRISMTTFSELDAEVLYSTIRTLIKKHYVESETLDIDVKEEEDKEVRWGKLLLRLTGLTILIGLIYGLLDCL